MFDRRTLSYFFISFIDNLAYGKPAYQSGIKKFPKADADALESYDISSGPMKSVDGKRRDLKCINDKYMECNECSMTYKVTLYDLQGNKKNIKQLQYPSLGPQQLDTAHFRNRNLVN